jgi:hypothetical protein
MISRRLALFRIASTSVAVAAIAVPVALAAVQPKSPENPVLVRLSAHLTKLQRIYRHRKAEMAKVRAAYEAGCPELPDLIRRDNPTDRFIRSEQLRDCEENSVWPDGEQPVRYYPVHNIRFAISNADYAWGEHAEAVREYVQQFLPVAEQYEREVEAARLACGVPSAAERLYWAEDAVYDVVNRIGEIPSVTAEGITIKAIAYEVLSEVKDAACANHAIAAGLAADVCRILSEGGEA